jgi:hypothetical protein
VAKVIATAGGIALKPGISKNRRLYTAPQIARAVARAQERVKAGDRPMNQLTFHGAGDNSREIAASLTGWSLDDDGNARWSSAFTDTSAGHDIASLVDTSDGQDPHLKNVSIRGYWLGTVRKVKGPDGQPVETADDIELEGLDFTKDPGVDGAEVDTFAWAGESGRSETTERVYITESVQEARVTITEETGVTYEGDRAPTVLSEAVREALAGGHVLENGLCVTCAPVSEGGDAPGDGSKPYGNVTYADPGYQSDKKKRYPLDSKDHAKSAWSYIAQKTNAAKYTAAQLKRVKGRIMSALKKFGVSASAESAGWTIGEPVAVGEALAEWWPGSDPQTSGSYCLTASNGPTSLTISSSYLDPEDLDPVIRAAADAACQALAALDPDMDGDIDVPGAPGADTDHDMGHESAPEDTEQTESAPASPAGGEEAAPAADTEEEAVSDTTTTEAAAPAPATVTLTQEQFDAMLARVAAPAAPAVPATEAAPAAAPAPAPVTPAAPVAETAEVREARIAALVQAGVAEAAAAQGLAVAETDEQMVARLIEAQLTPLRQAAAERNGTGTARKGLLDDIAEQAPGSVKVLQESSGSDLAALAGVAYAPRR